MTHFFSIDDLTEFFLVASRGTGDGQTPFAESEKIVVVVTSWGREKKEGVELLFS